MPISALNQKMTHGRYEDKHAIYLPDKGFQKKNNRTAASICGKLPQKCNANTLFISALLLTHMISAESSQVRPKRNSATATRQTLLSSEAPQTNRFCDTIKSVNQYNPACPFYAAPGCNAPLTVTPERLMHQNSNGFRPIEKREPLMHSPAFTPGLFQLPSAQAASDPAPTNGLIWHQHHQYFTLEDESIKSQLIDELADLLVKLDHLDPSTANNFSFQWRQRMAGRMLYLIPIQQKPAHQVQKRRSFSDINKEIARHIEEHCTVEQQLIDVDDKTAAEIAIYKLHRWNQFLDNPDSFLREVLQGPPVSPTLSTVFDKTGMIILLPIRILSEPLIPMIGNFLRSRHYSKIGDNICRIRENRLALANAASGLEVGGLGKFERRKGQIPKSPSSLHNIPLDSDAFIFVKNKQTGSREELILRAKSYTDNVNQLDKVILKPRTSSSYDGFPPGQGRSREDPISIEFNSQAEIWYQTIPPHYPLLEVEIQGGQIYAHIRGELYPLLKQAHMRYHVLVKQPSGQIQMLPVYRERISNTWHFRSPDMHPVFSPADKELIEKIKLNLEPSMRFELIDNDNPSYYLDGKIVQVSQPNSPSLFHAVEMDGELVPIQKSPVENYGNRYDTLNLKNLRGTSQTVIWDGDRWSLEKSTSPFLSKELKQQITPEMYVNVNIFSLSAPDQRGLRWDAQGNGYLKVKNEFVRVYPVSDSSLKFASGKTLSIIFVNEKFRPTQLTGARTVHVAPPAPFFPAPPNLNEDGPTKARFFATSRHLLESDWAPELGNTNIIDDIKSRHPNENVQIEQVPSSELQVVRTVLSIDDNKIVMDALPDGKNKKILTGSELLDALTKLRKRPVGGEVRNVVSLSSKKTDDAAITPREYQHQAGLITRERISAGYGNIKKVLDQHLHYENELTLILGNDDFFRTRTISSHAYADPETVYEALIDAFIPLSRAYPNAIIAPGTIYLSADIPISLRTRDLKYTQGNQTLSVQSAVHFSSVIAPVFYNGKIVTIARKGEYLTYQTPVDVMTHEGGYSRKLVNLNTEIPEGVQLVCHNENADGLILPVDSNNDRKGTIFAGKTLLPGEFLLPEKILRPHMADNATKTPFQSNFIIRNEKFLFVIGSEFIGHNDFRPSIRTMVLPKNDILGNGLRYDWILHTSTGQALDNTLRSIANNYLEVDNDDQSECLSAFTHRTHSVTTFSQSDMTVHQFDVTGN